MSRAAAARLVTLILILIAASGFALSPVGRELLHGHHERAHIWVHRHRIIAPGVFILVYVIVSITMLPAWWLHILSGICFGLIGGIVVAEIGTGVGAMITALLAEWLSEGWSHTRAEEYMRKLHAVGARLGHNGLIVVMAVRLVHIVPFGLSNYLFGLIELRIGEVVLGTIVGGLPTIAVYVATGANRHLLTDWRFIVGLVTTNLILLVLPLIWYVKHRVPAGNRPAKPGAVGEEP
jgi:uncharacterized membrane protein YdjX (TVP38/TMEM64 family)